MAEATAHRDGGIQPTTIALQDFVERGKDPTPFPGSNPEEYRDDDNSFHSNWTESTKVPRRNLGFIQCSALMINQMVGSGIFTLPGLILLLTKSKPIAIGLWAVGGIYSLLRFVDTMYF